jgi:replicative DNA helicase
MSAPRTTPLADPHAEHAYLAMCLLEPSVTERFPADPAWMTVARHRVLLEAMRAANEAGALDSITLRAELVRRKTFAGDEELLALTSAVPIVAHAERTRDRLADLHRERELDRGLAEALGLVREGKGEEARSKAEDALERARKPREERYTTTAAVAETTLGEAEVARAEDRQTTITTGIPPLDAAITGLEHGDMAVIGGDSSVGKSGVVLLCATAQALAGSTVGIVSLEDPPKRWGRRVLAAFSHVPVQVIQRAAWSDKQGESLTLAVGKARAHPIHLAFDIGGTLDEVVDSVRYLVREKGCRVVYVDYATAVTVPGVEDPTMANKILAARLKREVNRPGIEASLVVVSQMRKREDERDQPERKHLYFGQFLAQAAEIIVLLWLDQDRILNVVVDKSKDSGVGASFTLTRSPRTGMLMAPSAQEHETQRQRDFGGDDDGF